MLERVGYPWLALVVLLGATLWPTTIHHRTRLQAAVLRDGYAVVDGSTIREIDRNGGLRAEHTTRHRDVRLIGTRTGAALAWEQDGKVRVARAKDGLDLGTFGSSVRMLCDGAAANNDERSAVAWLEGDGSIWFLHAPVSPRAATTRPIHWCGIASAENDVALFWRDGDRLFINTCTWKKCSAVPASVALPRAQNLLGFGCVKKACLLATTERGKVELVYVTESGSIKWKKRLDVDPGYVSIVGVGSRSFAVAPPVDSTTRAVLRVEANGTMKTAWQGYGDETPAIAWSRDQLFVADGTTHAVIEMPR